MIKPVILILLLFLSSISVAQDNETLDGKLKKAVTNENLTGAVWSTISDDIITTRWVVVINGET